ncbi:MAG: InlB B-repeat-containing protein [Rickettsiales bacterium]|jgi:uncharacterized repeat protein (TIGR02543 family)|nr:InlB B-repeat-containing protein [Rickettsiales bacterium]
MTSVAQWNDGECHKKSLAQPCRNFLLYRIKIMKKLVIFFATFFYAQSIFAACVGADQCVSTLCNYSGISGCCSTTGSKYYACSTGYKCDGTTSTECTGDTYQDECGQGTCKTVPADKYRETNSTVKSCTNEPTNAGEKGSTTWDWTSSNRIIYNTPTSCSKHIYQCNNGYDISGTNDTPSANCSAINYDITYILNGGTNNASNPTTYTVETATITLLSPAKTGYAFDGWYTSSNFLGQAVTSIPKGSTGNKTFYAKWVCNGGYKCSDANCSSCAACDSGTFSTGPNSTTACTACAVGSYNTNVSQTTCTACAGGKTTENQGSTSCTDCNQKNVQTWETPSWTNNTMTNLCEIKTCNNGYENKSNTCSPETYNISYTLDGGTNNTSNPTTYTVETATITLLSPTKTGYTFSGWCDDSGLSSNCTTSKQIAKGSTGNKTFYAKWTVKIYTVTLDPNEGTPGTKSTVDVSYGSTIPNFLNPDSELPRMAGYIFNGYWSETVNGKQYIAADGTTISDAIWTTDGDDTLYAQWTECPSSGHFCGGSLYNDKKSCDTNLSKPSDFPTNGTYSTDPAKGATDPTSCRYKAPSKTLPGCEKAESNLTSYENNAWNPVTYYVTAEKGYKNINQDTASAECKPCENGEYQDETGQNECKKCSGLQNQYKDHPDNTEAATYSSNNPFDAATVCRYSVNRNIPTNCESIQMKTDAAYNGTDYDGLQYTVTNSSTCGCSIKDNDSDHPTCPKCLPGSAQNKEDPTKCTDCSEEDGFSTQEGATSCTPCPSMTKTDDGKAAKVSDCYIPFNTQFHDTNNNKLDFGALFVSNYASEAKCYFHDISNSSNSGNECAASSSGELFCTGLPGTCSLQSGAQHSCTIVEGGQTINMTCTGGIYTVSDKTFNFKCVQI